MPKLAPPLARLRLGQGKPSANMAPAAKRVLRDGINKSANKFKKGDGVKGKIK